MEQGPKPESSLDKPLTRRDFLKLLGLGGVVTVLAGVAGPSVESSVKQELNELDALLSENRDSLYFRLTRGELGVKMEPVDTNSANEIWQSVLNREKWESNVTTTGQRVDEDGKLWFYLENTERHFIFQGQEATLNYIPARKGRLEMVSIQVGGNEIYIAPYTTNYQIGTPDGKTESVVETHYVFVDKEGKLIFHKPGLEWIQYGQAAELFAATKALGPSGEPINTVVDTRTFTDNGKIFQIDIPEETQYKIQKAERSFVIMAEGLFKTSKGQFYRADFTRTGLKFMQENWGHPVAAYPPSETTSVVK